MRQSNADRRAQRGSATMEFALGVALVLVPLLLGIVDFSRYLSVSHTVSRAAHEGAFQAARGADPGQAVRSHVSAAGLDPAKLTVLVSPAVADSTRGTAMKVTVKYDLKNYALASWGGLFPQGVSMAATARRE